MGAAWARHAMCESVFSILTIFVGLRALVALGLLLVEVSVDTQLAHRTR
jgi:hypothetical protein